MSRIARLSTIVLVTVVATMLTFSVVYRPSVDRFPALMFCIVFIAIVGVYLYTIVWAYRDAEARATSGCLIAVLVALASWPLGLIAWLVFRPEVNQKRRDTDGRHAELEGDYNTEAWLAVKVVESQLAKDAMTLSRLR